MAPNRPGHLDLSDLNNDLPRPPRRNFHVDLPSPRTGEIPPALSPLDAFAAQSRMLAKKFEEQSEDGRRISRLPHTDVAREFRSRPGYFRTQSEDSTANMSDVPELNEELSPSHPTTSKGLVSGKDSDRPKSMYPVFGHAKKPSLGSRSPLGTPFYEADEYPGRSESRTQQQHQQQPPQDYFGVDRRAASPEQGESRFVNIEAPSPNVPSLTNSLDSVQSSQVWKTAGGSQHSQHSQNSQRSLRSDRGLAPPPSPRFPKSPRSVQSIRSVRQDNGDDGDGSQSGFQVTSHRKFSGSSNMSRPQSPFSPTMPPLQRSPSISSEYSINGKIEPPLRSPFANFSRPRSAADHSRQSMDNRPSMEGTSRELRPNTHQGAPSITSGSVHSVESAESTHKESVDEARTPYAGTDAVDTSGAGLESGYFGSNGAASYTYAKFSLPRGRTVERNSAGPSDSWGAHQFSYEQSAAGGDDRPHDRAGKVELRAPDRSMFDDTNRPPSAGSLQMPETRASRADTSATSSSRSKSAGPASRNHRSNASVATESTDHTIRATPLHQRSMSSELTPEENLEIGIQAHDAGHLNKSTYHLRLAAKAGVPTAMLLYALACRHGWGMRPNQADGVMWLQKAIDSSTFELENPPMPLRQDGSVDPAARAMEQKKRKAQYALAIYELGISYMNGWGCTKNKPLAVQCYEIAGNWGDCDALAEAGFCFTQGIGVKKDLKKAAKLYRRAEAAGMSMAGNSWIYKAKYLDDEPAAKDRDDRKQGKGSNAEKDKESQDKAGGRQRSRSIWGRKKEKDKAPGLPNHA